VRVLVTIATVLCAVSLFAASAQPVAAASRVVYVDVRMTATQKQNWGVVSAVDFVDRYTGSNMSFHACRSGYKCIIIQKKFERKEWAAVTHGASETFSASTRTYINLNPQRDYYSWSANRSIVAHEVAHANGVFKHSSTCNNIMYGGVFCPNGSLPPLSFTLSQKNRLKAN
jgi:hypothetical protein